MIKHNTSGCLREQVPRLRPINGRQRRPTSAARANRKIENAEARQENDEESFATRADHDETIAKKTLRQKAQNRLRFPIRLNYSASRIRSAMKLHRIKSGSALLGGAERHSVEKDPGSLGFARDDTQKQSDPGRLSGRQQPAPAPRGAWAWACGCTAVRSRGGRRCASMAGASRI